MSTDGPGVFRLRRTGINMKSYEQLSLEDFVYNFVSFSITIGLFVCRSLTVFLFCLMASRNAVCMNVLFTQLKSTKRKPWSTSEEKYLYREVKFSLTCVTYPILNNSKYEL